MNWIRNILLSFIFYLFILNIAAQNEQGYIGTHRIILPDLPEYYTLKCDFHIHTVFSDGLVWPTIRIDEALLCGLDVISITDHIEYQKFKKDISTDRNRSNEIATEYAKNKGLIVIPGAEITRDMPPGHCNALFIQDANKLVSDDVMTVFKEAISQGAFIIWNHPAWQAQKPDGVAKLFDIHNELLRLGYIKGIEIINEVTDDYSDEALDFMLKYNLAAMCNSDIHGLGEWEWSKAHHRPVTLVFAKEKTPESIKEALLAGRTLAYNDNYLIGREELLVSMFQSSVQIEAYYPEKLSIATVKIRNNSDVTYMCENKSKFTLQSTPYFFTIPAHSTQTILVKTLDRLDAFDFEILIYNLVKAPGKGTEVNLHIQMPK